MVCDYPEIITEVTPTRGQKPGEGVWDNSQPRFHSSLPGIVVVLVVTIEIFTAYFWPCQPVVSFLSCFFCDVVLFNKKKGRSPPFVSAYAGTWVGDPPEIVSEALRSVHAADLHQLVYSKRLCHYGLAGALMPSAWMVRTQWPPPGRNILRFFHTTKDIVDRAWTTTS